ncbi:MAG: amidohydrolase, partial [Clostridiales bacterium]|nr:amidohydrolase [Clostridiales bacterium]
MKVADFHAHIFPDKLAGKAAGSIGDFYGVQIARTASVDVLVAEEQAAGITRCVVSNSAVTPKQVHNINNFISEAVAAHPNFIGFGSIFP